MRLLLRHIILIYGAARTLTIEAGGQHRRGMSTLGATASGFLGTWDVSYWLVRRDRDLEPEVSLDPFRGGALWSYQECPDW